MTEEQSIVDRLKKRYPNWGSMPIPDRALLIAAEFADIIKVREATGRNDGTWVERFLRVFGLGKGNPWCAAFVGECYKLAGAKELPSGGAAVRNWPTWRFSKKVTYPKRGDLFYWLNANGTGHIGFVVRVNADGTFATIEGNTNSLGSREGDGCYRRIRSISSCKFLRIYG